MTFEQYLHSAAKEGRLINTAVVLSYDGDGNRAAKTINGVTTRYLVDDLNPTGYS